MENSNFHIDRDEELFRQCIKRAISFPCSQEPLKTSMQLLSIHSGFISTLRIPKELGDLRNFRPKGKPYDFWKNSHVFHESEGTIKDIQKQVFNFEVSTSIPEAHQTVISHMILDEIFKSMYDSWKDIVNRKRKEAEGSEGTEKSLNQSSSNFEVQRHMAGWIFLKLKRKFKRDKTCKHFFSWTLISGTENYSSSENWLAKLNRGGLTRVAEDVWVFVKKSFEKIANFYDHVPVPLKSKNKACREYMLNDLDLRADWLELFGTNNDQAILHMAEPVYVEFIRLLINQKGFSVAKHLKNRLIKKKGKDSNKGTRKTLKELQSKN